MNKLLLVLALVVIASCKTKEQKLKELQDQAAANETATIKKIAAPFIADAYVKIDDDFAVLKNKYSSKYEKDDAHDDLILTFREMNPALPKVLNDSTTDLDDIAQTTKEMVKEYYISKVANYRLEATKKLQIESEVSQ